MNEVKAKQFKQDLIDLLYRYNLSFKDFLEIMNNKDVIKYLVGLEDKKKEFFKFCKKVRFIVWNLPQRGVQSK